MVQASYTNLNGTLVLQKIQNYLQVSLLTIALFWLVFNLRYNVHNIFIYRHPILCSGVRMPKINLQVKNTFTNLTHSVPIGYLIIVLSFRTVN